MAYGIQTSLDLDSMRQTTAQFETYLKTLQQLADRNIVQVQMGDMNKQINETSRGMAGMNMQAKSFEENIGIMATKMVQFSLVMGAVMGTVKLLKDGMQQIADINLADVNIAMVTGDSVENVQKMNAGYLQMANNLKVLNSSVLDGAEAWLRSGANQATANANLETTTKLATIAGVSNKDMADSLIIIANQYKLNSTELEAYASKVAILDNTSATSSEKINSAMEYSAETFKATGVNMDDALAMVTNYSEKSAQSGEAIGRGFRSMLLNFQEMKKGFQSGDATETGAVNNLETLLNSKNIQLRKTKNDWVDLSTVITKIQQNISKFTPVQLSQVAEDIGGKQQAELTLSTLKNMTRINELKDKIANDNGGEALNNSYAKYLTSVKATQALLQNTLTELYQNTLNSTELKSGIEMLIQVIKFTEFLATDNKALVASYIGLVLIIKNFEALSLAVVHLGDLLGLLKTDGIEALAVLDFNPVILAITVLTAVVGAVALAQYKHKQEVIALKDEYVALDKAMKDMDSSSIKTQTDALQKQQEQLTKLATTAKENNVTGMGDAGAKDKNDLANYIKELEDAGFHVDTVTNKIVELGVAQSNINTNDTIKKIQEKNAKTVEETAATQALIQQYMSLSTTENKSADQKKILSNLSKELVGKVDGLTTSTDKNGNMTITNTGFLGKQVTVLDLLKQQSTITANTQIDNAIKVAQVMKNGTIMTLESMKQQLSGYLALNTALAGTKAGKEGFFGAITAGNDMGITSLQKSIDDINTLKASSEIALPALTDDSAGYTATTKAKKADAKELTAENKALALATKLGTDANKDLETSLKALDTLYQAQTDRLATLVKGSKAYGAELDAQTATIKEQIALTKQQIATDTSNATVLSGMETSKSTITSSASSSTTSASGAYDGRYAGGLYKDQINAVAKSTGVSANLIAGLIQTESSFINGQTNASGHAGLGQFDVGSAKQVGMTSADRYDAKKSIKGIADLILLKLKEGAGTLDQAIMNYGEGTPKYLATVKANSGGSVGSITTGTGAITSGTGDSASTDTSGSSGLLSTVESAKASLLALEKTLAGQVYLKFENSLAIFDNAITAETTKINNLKNQLASTSNTDKQKTDINDDIEAQMRRELTMGYNKANFLSTEMKSNKYNAFQLDAMNTTLQETLVTNSDIVNQIQAQIVLEDALALSIKQVQYAKDSKPFEDKTKELSYKDSTLSSTDTKGKVDSEWSQLDNSNKEYNTTNDYLGTLIASGATTKSKEGRDALIAEIDTTTAKLREEALAVQADAKAWADANIADITTLADKNNSDNANIVSNLQDNAKYNLKAGDQQGQIDSVSQQQQIDKNSVDTDTTELAKETALRDDPSIVKDSTMWVEYNNAVIATTASLRTDTTTLLDTNDAMTTVLLNAPAIADLTSKMTGITNAGKNLFDSDSVGKVQNEIDVIQNLSATLDSYETSYNTIVANANKDGIVTQDEQNSINTAKGFVDATTQSIKESYATLETLNTANMIAPFEKQLTALNDDLTRYNFLIKASSNASYDTQMGLNTDALANNKTQMQSLIEEYYTLSSESIPTTAQEMTDYIAKLNSVKTSLLSASEAQDTLRKSMQDTEVQQVLDSVTIPQDKITKIVAEIDFNVSMGQENLGNLIDTSYTETTKTLDETISDSASEANDIATSIDDKVEALATVGTDVTGNIDSNTSVITSSISDGVTTISDAITNSATTTATAVASAVSSSTNQASTNSAGGVWVQAGYANGQAVPAHWAYMGQNSSSSGGDLMNIDGTSVASTTVASSAKTIDSNSWKDGLVDQNTVASDLPSTDSLQSSSESATKVNQLLIIKSQLTERDALASKANIAYLEEQKVNYADNLDALKKITAEQDTQLADLQKDETLMTTLGTQIADSLLTDSDKNIVDLQNEIKMMGTMSTPVEFSIDEDSLKKVGEDYQAELQSLTNEANKINPELINLEDLKTAGTLTDEEKLRLIELQGEMDEIKSKTVDVTVNINTNISDQVTSITNYYANEAKVITDITTGLQNGLTSVQNIDATNYSSIETLQQEIYNNSLAQYNLNLQSANALKTLRDASVVGSEAWNSYNTALETVDTSTQTTILSMETQAKALLQTQDSIASANILASIFGSSSPTASQDAQDKIDAQKLYNSTYIDGAEKTLAIDKIRTQINDEISTSSSEASKTILKASLAQLDTLEQSSVLTRAQLDDYQKKLDVTEAQNALDNAMNDRSVQTLTKQADGTYDYSYGADQSKVDSLKEDLEQKQVDLITYERDTNLTAQQTDLDNKTKYMSELQTIMTNAQNGLYATQADLQTALDALGVKFGISSSTIDTNLTDITTAYSSYTSNMVTLSNELTTAVNALASAMNTAISTLPVTGVSTNVSTGTTTTIVGAHANGTPNAKGGNSLVDEEGMELKISNGRITALAGGDGISTAETTNNLNLIGSLAPKLSDFMTNPMNYIQGLLSNIKIPIGIGSSNNLNPQPIVNNYITADFPNATDHTQIEQAFSTINLRAHQRTTSKTFGLD